MRYFNNSRSLQIGLILSILLHLCFFIYLYYSSSLEEIEKVPVAVEFISPPKERQKAGRSYITLKKEYKMPRAVTPEPYAKDAPIPQPPAKSTETLSPDITQEAHSLDVPRAPAQPDIIPSPERLAKIEEEKREGEADEETISLYEADIKYDSYKDGLTSKIQGVWRYPEAAIKLGLQGKGLISFTINRDGTLKDVTLLRSSGYPILDEGVIEAIKKAAPYNPFQENMPIKRLRVVATFEYNLIIQRIWGR